MSQICQFDNLKYDYTRFLMRQMWQKNQVRKDYEQRM